MGGRPLLVPSLEIQTHIDSKHSYLRDEHGLILTIWWRHEGGKFIRLRASTDELTSRAGSGPRHHSLRSMSL